MREALRNGGRAVALLALSANRLRCIADNLAKTPDSGRLKFGWQRLCALQALDDLERNVAQATADILTAIENVDGDSEKSQWRTTRPKGGPA